MVVALLIVACSGEPTPDPTSTTDSLPASTTSTDSGVHADVPPIDCGPLIGFDEIDVVFDKVGEFPDFLTFEDGEACTYRLAEDEAFYVRVEPGHPDDFAPAARINDVSGEPVQGVGKAALWFGEEGAGVSTISVRAASTFGALHYRVTLSRPDADADAHREVTRMLALAALGRFPGAQDDPFVIEFPTGPADLSDLGYAGNLLSRESEGEWSRGDGLVATLGYLAGEIDAASVLRHPMLLDYTATPVIALALEYLATGPEDPVKTEIARLLDQIFPPPTRRGEMVEQPAAGAGLLVSLWDVVAQEDDPCMSTFGIPAPCLIAELPPELEAKWPGQYVVFRPVASVAGGWDLQRIDATVTALTDAVTAYAKLVEMPPVQIYLLNGEETLTTGVQFHDGACLIDVFPLMQEYSPVNYQQFLARDVAYCLIWHSFGGVTAFWSDGLATYLSGYVYTATNLELTNLPGWLEDTELQTPLQSRTFTNWVLFEYLHESIGAKGNLELVGGLAEGGLGPLTARWHSFNEKLTDADVADQGGGLVPYRPPFEDVQATGPIVMPPKPDPIGVARAQMTVPTGEVACVSYETTGAVTVSWRSGVPGTSGGSWSTDLPDELTDVSVFLVTTSDAGQLTMTVEKVVDQEDGCEEDVIDLDDPSDCLTLQCGPSGYYFEVSED